MKKIFSYKEAFPVLLLCLYAFGYVFLKAYYWVLGIDIEYYINLSDIIFFAINLFLLIAFPITIFEFIIEEITLMILKLIKRKRLKLLNKIDRRKLLNVDNGTLFVGPYFTVLFIFFTLGILFFENIIYFLAIFILLVFLKVLYVIRTSLFEENRIITAYGLLFASLLIVSILLGITIAKNLTTSFLLFNSTNEISFDTDSSKIGTNTNGNTIFIGQTTDYLFIYNSSTKVSKAYRKDSLTNLEFINSQ